MEQGDEQAAGETHIAPCDESAPRLSPIPPTLTDATTMSQPPPSGGPYAPPAVPRPGGGAFSSAAPSPGAFDSSSYSRATSTDPGMLTQGGPGTPVDGAVGAGGGGQSEDDQLPDSGAATPTLQTDFEDGNNSSSTPAPSAQPAKRSKALNFLKKKETKVVSRERSPLSPLYVDALTSRRSTRAERERNELQDCRRRDHPRG